MASLDWIVLALTLLGIVGYGIYKSRGQKNIDGYLLADREMPWYKVGLSVMATQASAITFLSAPGQAFTDGTRFVQFYFGLPLAMLVLCITFIPIFHRLKVYTAYEYLEQRFDAKTRAYTAILFLIQRGISTGITIYAPSIILSTILGVSQVYTTIIIGLLVIAYTVYGGTKAVGHTHFLQMIIIFTGMFLAGYVVVASMPDGIGFKESLDITAHLGKLNTIDWKFDPSNKYNVWSGLIGGFFLALSYFGTDQSQVGRYLAGRSIRESRMGLIMNGIVKIPMQYLILLIGALLVVFYQFYQAPVYFNKVGYAAIENAEPQKVNEINRKNENLNRQKKESIQLLAQAYKTDDEKVIVQQKDQLLHLDSEYQALRKETKELVASNGALQDSDDSNYIFLRFVTEYMPTGLIGLLIAVIFLASMGSTAAGLNALGSTSMVDIYKRFFSQINSEEKELAISRIATVFWGVFCIGIALFAGRLGNLIEAVNILGSLFYGTILGIFICGFYFKSLRGNAVFVSALLTEALVLLLWYFNVTAFLWLNVIGAIVLVFIAFVIQLLNAPKINTQNIA